MAMQIIEEGFRNLVIRFSGAGANTVDVSALSPPCADLRVLKIYYNAPADQTAVSTIAGDATADEVLWNLSGHSDTFDFIEFGGLVNNAGAGKTGDLIVTVGDADTSIVVWFKKVDTVAPFPN